MNKKDFSERDICTQFIVPALKKAGWDLQRQVREEVSFTDGRIYVNRKEQAQLLMQTVLREAFDSDSAAQQSVLND
jgi:type I site-specific restriction endonuclease